MKLNKRQRTEILNRYWNQMVEITNSKIVCPCNIKDKLYEIVSHGKEVFIDGE